MPSRSRVVKGVVAAMLFGALVAVVKGQGAGVRDALGNISAPWLLIPFIAGAACRRVLAASLVGLGASLSALAGFYVAEGFILDLGSHPLPVDLRLTLVAGQYYFLASVFSGPVFGALGGVWAKRRSRPAAGALAGAFLLEPLAVYLWERQAGSVGTSGLLTQYPWMWMGEITLGLAMGVLLISHGRSQDA